MKFPNWTHQKKFLHTCVSRRMNRSTDIRSSIPTEQCLAMAHVSSDWTWNGGNTPVMNPHPEWWKEGNLALTGLHNTLLPQATWNLYNAQALFQLVIRSYMGPTWCCPIKSIEFIQDGWFPNTWSSNHSKHCEICIICWQKLQLQVRAPSPSCIECKPTRQTAALCHHDKNQAYSYCLPHGSKIRISQLHSWYIPTVLCNSPLHFKVLLSRIHQQKNRAKLSGAIPKITSQRNNILSWNWPLFTHHQILHTR